jgi:hypothetical protein
LDFELIPGGDKAYLGPESYGVMKQIPYAWETGNSFGAIREFVVGNREILGPI